MEYSEASEMVDLMLRRRRLSIVGLSVTRLSILAFAIRRVSGYEYLERLDLLDAALPTDRPPDLPADRTPALLDLGVIGGEMKIEKLRFSLRLVAASSGVSLSNSTLSFLAISQVLGAVCAH